MRALNLILLCGLALTLLPGGCPPTLFTDEVVLGARFETNAGEFAIAFDIEAAPDTVAAFVENVQNGYYEGVVVHRIVDDMLVEAGGYSLQFVEKEARDPIVNEAGNGLSNTRGTIAMARTTEPDSARAQFYFNLTDNPELDPSLEGPGYAVFGQVIEGMETVDAIGALETGTRDGFDEVPLQDVVIQAATRVENPGGPPRVRIETNFGNILVELNADAAPVTVDNFLQYVDAGFYAGTIFHRVVPEFVIQGGGFVIEPALRSGGEPLPNALGADASNRRGTVAVAAADPAVETSQFLFNLSDNLQQDQGDGYTVFARVVEGIEVLEEISARATATRNNLEQAPAENVVIRAVTLEDVLTGEQILTPEGAYYVDTQRYRSGTILRNLAVEAIRLGILSLGN